MAVGAIFAALNTMYSAVTTRTVEIATLRAIGFGGTPVVVSVMIEALLLATLGGVVGAALAYLIFNGLTVSTLNNASFSQVAFDFAVTPKLITQGLVWAVSLGFVGGLFPALRAARLPITVALRGE
jgi:putative ABC transport system permease protein